MTLNRTRKKAWLEVYEISVKGIEKPRSDIKNYFQISGILDRKPEEVKTASSGLYMEQIISKEGYELMKRFFIISWNEEYLEANIVGGPFEETECE